MDVKLDPAFPKKLMSLWPPDEFIWRDGKIWDWPIEAVEGFELIDTMNFYRWPGKGKRHENQ